jgi:hypothetical protein
MSLTTWVMGRGGEVHAQPRRKNPRLRLPKNSGKKMSDIQITDIQIGDVVRKRRLGEEVVKVGDLVFVKEEKRKNHDLRKTPLLIVEEGEPDEVYLEGKVRILFPNGGKMWIPRWYVEKV